MKLVDCWRDLEPGLQHSLHPLEPDVLGPLDEAAEVPLRLDVLADSEVPGALLEEWVDHFLHLWLLDGQGGRGHLLSLLVLHQIGTFYPQIEATRRRVRKCENLNDKQRIFSLCDEMGALS